MTCWPAAVVPVGWVQISATISPKTTAPTAAQNPVTRSTAGPFLVRVSALRPARVAETREMLEGPVRADPQSEAEQREPHDDLSYLGSAHQMNASSPAASSPTRLPDVTEGTP